MFFPVFKACEQLLVFSLKDFVSYSEGYCEAIVLFPGKQRNGLGRGLCGPKQC